VNRPETQLSTANPFGIWINLALMTNEMLAASAHVISHRCNRMALAGVVPNARDRKEFTLMGQEKIEAAVESANAMAVRMLSVQQQMGAMLFQQFLGSVSGMMTLATSRTLGQTGRRQAALMRDAMTNSAATASHFSGSLARVAHHGLKPIHLRATGNSKRLRKG
jgi:uncharacterized protein (DUF2342 family)